MNISTCNACAPENLEKLIREKGTKKYMLAHIAGFSTQQLSDMLNGRKLIKPCDIIALANALGCSVDKLFIETGGTATRR